MKLITILCLAVSALAQQSFAGDFVPLTDQQIAEQRQRYKLASIEHQKLRNDYKQHRQEILNGEGSVQSVCHKEAVTFGLGRVACDG